MANLLKFSSVSAAHCTMNFHLHNVSNFRIAPYRPIHSVEWGAICFFVGVGGGGGGQVIFSLTANARTLNDPERGAASTNGWLFLIFRQPEWNLHSNFRVHSEIKSTTITCFHHRNYTASSHGNSQLVNFAQTIKSTQEKNSRMPYAFQSLSKATIVMDYTLNQR